jgi:hypothetical protein
MLRSRIPSALLGVALFATLPAHAASPAYSAALTLASLSPTVGGADKATLTLTNAGASAANAGLTIDMPPGFTANTFSTSCGGSLAPSANGANQLTLAGATVPAGGACTFRFTVQLPPVAAMPPAAQRTFALRADASPGLATLAASSVPTLGSILGAAPGLYADTAFPPSLRSVAQLDMFITPETDPGPNSNVYWSNQVNSLNGYTGLQSTELVSAAEGHGKQFLFSLWGATDARPGTPASAGIGAGSYCTVSGTATDGAAGAQCRYRYEWQPGHTYRFRITPDTALGAGWYKSNVTDVTPGSTGDTFDIGSIHIGNGQTQVPVTSISQWVEYFDWNSSRTSCTSVAYTHARFSIEAFDALGNAVKVPQPRARANATCPSDYAQATAQGAEATLIGGPKQSAEGLFKVNGSGVCLAARNGLVGGTAAGPNPVRAETCPTLAAVQRAGGGAFSRALWVRAGDGTIQTKHTYCLTALPARMGGQIVLETCVAGARAQQWQVVQPAGAGSPAQLVSNQNGRCLTPAQNGDLSLQPCSATNQIWIPPGRSFAY